MKEDYNRVMWWWSGSLKAWGSGVDRLGELMEIITLGSGRK